MTNIWTRLTDSCAASIIGSCISEYILAKALKPPGKLYTMVDNNKTQCTPLTSILDNCLSCDLISSLMALGLDAISIACLIRSGLFSIWDNSGLR